MRNKYTGPYQITSISSNSQYYLKDKYSHQLKRPVPASQVVHYYGVGDFCRQKIDVENCENDSSNDNGNVSDSQSMPDDIGAAASDSESVLDDNGTVSDTQSVPDEIGGVALDSQSIPDDCSTLSDTQSIQDDLGPAESYSDSIQHNMDISDTENMQGSSTHSNTCDNNCQRSKVHCQYGKHDKDQQENLVPSQITILQSNVMPFLSDESVLDVGVDDYVQGNDKIFNPWGDMNVNNIPLEIDMDTDSDSSMNKEPLIVKSEKPPDVVFSPLSNIECLNSAKKFYIKLRPSDHTIHFKGIGLVFKHRPVVTIAARPDGACLFNSMSPLLYGTDVYSQIIRHVICNYISAQENYSELNEHIPPQYSSGKEYVEKQCVQQLCLGY